MQNSNTFSQAQHLRERYNMLGLNLDQAQRKIVKLLLLMAAVIFFICIFPNSVASKNISMVQIFEPDEAAPLPFLFNMVTPAGSLAQTIKNFIFYHYYFYSFPHFALSALMILPLQWFNQLGNIPLVQQYYGELLFLLVCLGLVLWGIIKSSNRLLHGLILAWFIPLSVMVFFFSHFKYQYWMPAILPVLSCVVVLLPKKFEFSRKQSAAKWFQLALLAVVAIQFGLFINSEIPDYFSRLHRAENNPSIIFYDQVVATLKPVQDQPLNVYYDYRMYLPPHQCMDIQDHLRYPGLRIHL